MKRLSAAFLMLILILSLGLFASAAQKNIPFCLDSVYTKIVI